MSKIIGIGNALVDIIVNIEKEDILDRFSLKKGGMEMIDSETKRSLHNAISEMRQVTASGGSTANTIHGLARLGVQTGFIGKISQDNAGQFFSSDLQNSNVNDHLIYTDVDTGIATTLMTSDAERTFATYLGAAAMMTPEEIRKEIFKDYHYILVEGYLIFNRDLILKVCQYAKEHGLKIAMDMASYNLVETNRDFIHMLLEEYVDIIFANEEEAKAFTGKEEYEALEELSKLCEVAVVKIGCRGSLASVHGKVTAIPPQPANCIDTNGAGDIYAAGFLYGLMKNLPVEETGKLASMLSAKLVETTGAKLSDQQWAEVRLMINS
ncbi:adenosine kinase [Bacteroidales bacterium OttesenSCG-928-B11]|nr:adenosine kinase [Bacteroidales bacterium OttesenSCG-928-C03]MDL2311581.1 adenosine kinase [Bacteroidales bacterium OttesenSCG-928-B11]